MLNVEVQLCNQTYAIIIDECVYSFTTVYAEIELIVFEFCDENNLEYDEVQIWETF